MKVTVKRHYSPAVKAMTDQFFSWDPYNGMFWEEMADCLENDYRTLEGCKHIIDSLVEFTEEILENYADMKYYYSELKRGINNA